jgi:hypothetical protein
MTDPRDKRIAELEARVDKLVDAIAKLASERPTVVALPYPVAPYVPTVPYYPPWPSLGQPIWVWNTSKTVSAGTVTIWQSALGGSVSNRGEIGVSSRPSPTMTVIG